MRFIQQMFFTTPCKIMRLNLTANMFVTPEGKLNYDISFHITVPKNGE